MRMRRRPTKQTTCAGQAAGIRTVSAGYAVPQPIASFSFIRTMTVGSGVQPDLLTLPERTERRSRAWRKASLPPVGLSPAWERCRQASISAL